MKNHDDHASAGADLGRGATRDSHSVYKAEYEDGIQKDFMKTRVRRRDDSSR